MNLKMDIKGITAPTIAIQDIAIDVEYSIEEFMAMAKAYPEIINAVIAGVVKAG